MLWQTGRFDAALPGFAPAQALRSPGERVEFHKLLNVHYIAFRATTPPFDDVLVRRAFAMALDRRANRGIGRESRTAAP